MSPSNPSGGLCCVGKSRLADGDRDGAMRRRRRPQLCIEVRSVQTVAGVPAGDLHPYRHLDDEEREALLLDSLLRILRESAEVPAAQPAPDVLSESRR